MGNILVFAEQQDGQTKGTSFELAAKASQLAKELGGEAQAVYIGATPGDAADLGKYGISKVTVLENADLAKYNGEGYAKVLADFIQSSSPSAVLGTASSAGKDFFPRLAARLDAGLASDCTDLRAEGGKLVATRPVFSGKAIVDVDFGDSALVLVTTRPNSFVKAEQGGGAAVVETAAADAGTLRAVVTDIQASESKEVDLTEAQIIISGGRAMKDAENFKILRECAEVIGATVGASRAAVDSGYAPHSMQVGQTGKVVNPNLYIACGISGAIQHLAGMRTSKCIVVINKDADAPLFQKADYGIVGDLFEIIPAVTEELKKLKAAA